jgi:hypothetical protein
MNLISWLISSENRKVFPRCVLTLGSQNPSHQPLSYCCFSLNSFQAGTSIIISHISKNPYVWQSLQASKQRGSWYRTDNPLVLATATDLPTTFPGIFEMFPRVPRLSLFTPQMFLEAVTVFCWTLFGEYYPTEMRGFQVWLNYLYLS